jgi:hypothetical protein
MTLALRRNVPPCARKAIVKTIRTQRHIERLPWFPKLRSLATDEVQQGLLSIVVDLTAHHEPTTFVATTVVTTDEELRRLWLKYYKSRIAQDVILHMTHDVTATMFLLYTITAVEILLERM